MRWDFVRTTAAAATAEEALRETRKDSHTRRRRKNQYTPHSALCHSESKTTCTPCGKPVNKFSCDYIIILSERHKVYKSSNRA